MKEVRYFFVPNANVEKELPTEEAIHALRVLRLKEGDEIFLMDVSIKLKFHWLRQRNVSIRSNKY
mgnify:CR=1 FL=1